jgi:hypothetical protein
MSSTRPFAKFFTDKLSVKFTIPVLVVMLISSSLLSFDAYGQVDTRDCFAPLTTILDATYAGPVVVDSYWVDQGTSATDVSTNNPIKKEIGPGEGPSVFAVVLNSRSASSILSITGFLNLPSGYTATGSSQNPQLLQSNNQASKVASHPAVADYNGIVQPGSTFILYFNVNVSPNTKVGTYPTTMVVNYNIQGAIAQQCTSALLNVPFVLPGKVVLDASTVTSDLAPQSKNPISIAIENKGSADATGVVATIVNLGNSKGSTGNNNGGSVVLQSSTTQLVNLGPNTFNLGTIPAKSQAVISTTVYPSTAASGSTQEVQLQINYQNAWGKLSTANISTGLVIAPNPPQSLSLSYLGNTTTPVITAAMLDDLDFAVQNNSTNPMSNIVISLVPQSTSVSIVGSSTWTIQNMNPGDRHVLATKVYAANSLINTPTSFTLTANYISKGQSQTNSLTLGTFVVGNIKLQIYDLSASSVGGAPTLAGNLLNQGSTTGLYTTMQLAPSQLVDAMRAARLANSTNEQAQSSPQSAQADQGSSGLQGGQDTSGSRFGGQGFQGRGGQGGPRGTTQQFIGDLSPDSPIPFSIPLRGINSLQPGMYQVAFKVTYADDLKNFHNVILNGTVAISKAPQINQKNQQTSIFDYMSLPMIVAAGAGVAVIIVFLVKRKKSRSKKLQLLTKGDTDIVSIFDGVKKKDNES